jgi:hypothetical protein
LYLTDPDPHQPNDVLAMVRDLYSERPESRYLEAYELQSLLWSLRYCEDLIPESEIDAAIEVSLSVVVLDPCSCALD